jgi:hypothetical protein
MTLDESMDRHMKIINPISFFSAHLCSVMYISFTILAYSQYPLSFSPMRNWLSDLGNQVDNPQGAIFYNLGVIFTAVFLAIWFIVGLSQWRLKHHALHRRLLTISQTAGVLAAFALIMSALYPINMPQLHSFWSQMHFLMFGMGFGFSVAALRYHPHIPKTSLYLGTGAALLPTLMLAIGKAYWLEWIAVGLFIIYILSISLATLTLTKRL